MITSIPSVSQVYAVYYRKAPRTSIAFTGCLQASNLESANAQAKAIVSEKYPDGCVLNVMLAKDSAWPLMNANGDYVAPSKS